MKIFLLWPLLSTEKVASGIDPLARVPRDASYHVYQRMGRADWRWSNMGGGAEPAETILAPVMGHEISM